MKISVYKIVIPNLQPLQVTIIRLVELKLVNGKYQENVIMTAENGGEGKKSDWTRSGSLLVF